ncbi:hypothetical protein N7539_000864 [Penicillium diatomitis]|uniref:Smr domain-containing protein n=1 Tax=Penicillium diatomitis TaxID=2819901 RepID=A0A9W9XMN5_9EURO|nr:uncharacterized protein N7539_000864 [Penicillium diatomitis]KAJ5495748.1 hypothetical protein N7539_000864 [Penicillium diatomitis]
MEVSSSSADARTKLEQEYCPPVDSALLAALALDFDLDKSDDVKALRETLDSIKESALQEEYLTFDPSGTAGNEVDSYDNSGTCSGSRDTFATGTPSTSQYSQNLPDGCDSRSAKSRDASQPSYTLGADGSLQFVGGTEEGKISLLQEMFPDITRFNIEQGLKKSDGDVDKAMDSLLNLSFFHQGHLDESAIAIPKGLDGFMQETPDIGRQKPRKKRSKKHKVSFEADAAGIDHSHVQNQWQKSNEDVEFIYSRTPDLPRSTIASTYTHNNRSLSLTIKALADSHSVADIDEVRDDSVVQSQLDELASDFPNVPQPTLVGLLRITRNIFSAANELAAEMIRQKPSFSVSDLIKITAPKLNLEDEEEDLSARPTRSVVLSQSATDFDRDQAAANAYFTAKSVANAKAAQAARKAKSDPLYGGATHYYREVAQQNRELAMRHLSAATERLVDMQSSSGDLDLHGCQVAQAVRISRERVEAWWDGLGDTKHIRGGGRHAHNGYKIITGVGLHSHDGKSRLGPAVSKALISDGWRVEIGRGFVTVIGAARR